MLLGLTVLSLSGDRVELRGRIDGLVGLEDVRARCRLEPVGRWPSLVVDALQGLALALESGGVPVDLAAAGPLLRSRVVSEGAVLADDVAWRPLTAGLVEVLVAEVGGAVRQLHRTTVDAWRTPLPDLLARGREQVLRAGLLTRRELDLDGCALTALESTGAFAATHVHWLGTYVDPPPGGLLVALPTRHLVLVAAVLDREQVLRAAQALLVNADRLWRDGPGALSPDLYWWRDGELMLLPGTPTSLSPPAAFVEVLDALPFRPPGTG